VATVGGAGQERRGLPYLHLRVRACACVCSCACVRACVLVCVKGQHDTDAGGQVAKAGGAGKGGAGFLSRELLCYACYAVADVIKVSLPGIYIYIYIYIYI
jgi:hypothetical protein